MERYDTATFEPVDDDEEPGSDVALDSDAAETEELAEGYKRCEACHAVLPPNVGICPVCGHVH